MTMCQRCGYEECGCGYIHHPGTKPAKPRQPFDDIAKLGPIARQRAYIKMLAMIGRVTRGDMREKKYRELGRAMAKPYPPGVEEREKRNLAWSSGKVL